MRIPIANPPTPPAIEWRPEPLRLNVHWRALYLEEIDPIDQCWGRHEESTFAWRAVRVDNGDFVYGLCNDLGPLALVAVRPKNISLLVGSARYSAVVLTFFEVGPEMRGKGVGAIAIAALAHLAASFDADAIVLGSSPAPELVQWYRNLGAGDAPKSWKPPKGTTALWFSPVETLKLRGRFDEAAQ